jgi:hypothetical protein
MVMEDWTLSHGNHMHLLVCDLTDSAIHPMVLPMTNRRNGNLGSGASLDIA